jgi:hypothetical protein
LAPSLASGTSQGPSMRRYALSHRDSRAPWCSLAGTTLSTTSLTGSRTGPDKRRQTPSRPQGARGLLGLHVSPSSRPPSPPRSLQKAHLGEASPSRHSLTLSMLEQSSRTTPKASSAPQHHHGPHDTAVRPSWTSMHVDHRINSPKPPCTRPTSEYKGEVRS